MAFLPESAVWGAGIYQLEETDPVQGGPNGVDNAQAKEIANRLLYLKNLAESLGADKLDAAAKASSAQAIAGVDNATWMTPLRVAEAIAALASIAMATDTTAGKVELATSAETVAGTDTQRATHPAGVKAAIDAAVSALVNSSPATLNTLAEIATALGNDPNFATSITSIIAGKQPLDGTLTALSGLTTSANQIPYATGADAFSMTALTAFARSLIDDSDAAAARATLGLGDLSTRSLSVDFNASFAANGYQKLPGGLIIQWGTTALISTDALLSVTFPIAFPNAALSITGSGVSSQISGGATQTGFNFPTLSTTGFIVANDTTQNNIRWIAIGY